MDSPRIVSRLDRGWGSITLFGDFDLAGRELLVGALRRQVAAGKRFLIVDAARITFLDMGSLVTLEEAARFVAAGHGRLILWRPSRAVRYLLDVRERTFPGKQWALQPADDPYDALAVGEYV